MRSRPIPTDIGTKRRFLELVQHAEDGCWLWQGKMNGEYGLMELSKGGFLAHRVSYFLHRGQPRVDMVIDHKCRNKRCVNPDHLEQVTVAENARRYLGAAPNKDDRSRTLDDVKVVQIKQQLAAGVPAEQIAAEFGITPKHVQKIRRGVSWGHVTVD